MTFFIPMPIRRSVALAIDIIFLNICFSYLLKLFPLGFINVLCKYNGHTYFIGFILAAFYFIICESYILKGKTLGKLSVFISVKDIKGQDLKLINSVYRFLGKSWLLFYSFPFFYLLQWVNPANFRDRFYLEAIYNFCYFFYSFIFMFKMFIAEHGRTLHDLMSNSVVLADHKIFKIEKQETRKKHKIFIVIFFIMLGFFTYRSLIKNQKLFEKNAKLFKEMEVIQTKAKDIFSLKKDKITIKIGVIPITGVKTSDNKAVYETNVYIKIVCIYDNYTEKELKNANNLLYKLTYLNISKLRKIDNIIIRYVKKFDTGLTSFIREKEFREKCYIIKKNLKN